MKCYVCDKSTETRPYGEGGKPICAPCMKDPAHPEREIEAKRRFAGKIAGDEPKLIGVETGPVPFRPANGGDA